MVGSKAASKVINLIPINLIGVANDGWINASEKPSTQPILSIGSVPTGISTDYALAMDTADCTTASYQAFTTAPTAGSMSSSTDGRYKFCIRFTATMANQSSVRYGSSAVFEVDTVAPTNVNAGSDETTTSLSALPVTGTGPSTGTTGLTYNWSSPDSGVVISVPNASTPWTANVTPSASGTYKLIFTVSDAAGNKTSDDKLVTFSAPPSNLFILGPDSLPWFACAPAKVQLSSLAPSATTVTLSVPSPTAPATPVGIYSDASCSSSATSVSIAAQKSEGAFFLRATDSTASTFNLTATVTIPSSGQGGSTTISQSRPYATIPIPLNGEASDGTITSAESTATTAAVTLGSLPNGVTASYAFVSGTNTCSSASSFTTSAPTISQIAAGSDGSRFVCVKFSAGTDFLIGSSKVVAVNKSLSTSE